MDRLQQWLQEHCEPSTLEASASGSANRASQGIDHGTKMKANSFADKD